jgi:signal transduction histidine kinase
LHRVFETGQIVVSDIYVGGLLHRPVMSIDVPVVIDGRVAYDLSVGLFPERLGGVIRDKGLPPDWVATIYDTQGVIAARTLSPEQFVGRKASPALIEHMARAAEGMAETATVEGIPVSFVFSRSPISHWAVTIGIPTQLFAAELRRRFVVLGVGVSILLGIGVGLAWLVAARIAGSIHALTVPALALGSGAAVAVPRARLREVDDVATALGTASELLSRRTQELETANAEMQEFSYSISHDLSTPLRAIAGFAQIVAEDHGAALDAEALGMLTRIRENTGRMNQLIDGLIDFMQMSRRKLIHDRVDMAALAHEVFEALRAATPTRRLDLQVDDLPAAWGDLNLLRRVLQNLMDNAAKFIPADIDGRIELAGKAVAGETVYRLSDNGIGFDMQYADKLFKVFEHVHAPGQFEGVGIGLAVVKRIVGRHGGRVWAEGKVGEGATFFFALPAKSPDN